MYTLGLQSDPKQQDFWLQNNTAKIQLRCNTRLKEFLELPPRNIFFKSILLKSQRITLKNILPTPIYRID